MRYTTTKLLRIATWNCSRGLLASKRAALDYLAADLIVLTEASPPTSADEGTLWFGMGRYGVAICAKEPFRLRELPSSRAAECVYPVRVEGPQSFTLFGIWTVPRPSYIRALQDGLEAHASVSGPRVLAGDFNGNVGFDKPRSHRKWADLFARLGDNGLVSAYHRGRVFGQEPDPTHYFRWKQDAPFHLDYCFVPAAWEIEAVTIPGFAELTSFSDHRPVVVDVRVV